ncbi:MAG TPA: DUF1579 domain-containing protein [Lacipirellulaceae bacterium]|nr:DUF1579 domain-containing protein [Lacipirellulaceae bacterium]
MKKFASAGLVFSLFIVACQSNAQESPEMPSPQKEHQWLNKLVGEWDTEGEMQMGPGADPIKSTGTDSARMLGGFWLVSDVKGEVMGTSIEARLTLGYDPAKKKYVGTWIDSMTSYMWNYEGSVDDTGKILTLNTEGPGFHGGGQMTKFKEVIEIKNKDERTFTSSFQEEDGTWTKMMSVTYRRKK